MKKILLLSILSIFVLSACEEGMGVNITLKSKDKEKDASSALSLDIDGKDIKVGTSSVESFVSNGKKITVESGDSVKFSPDKSAQTINPVDWTPLFKSWESGCLNMPYELDNLFTGLHTGNFNLPQPYQSSVSSKIASELKGDDYSGKYQTYTTQITGTYYDLPVSKIGIYDGIDNGINGYTLTLAIPLKLAQQTLQQKKVIYNSPKVPEWDDNYGQASVSGNELETTITCALST